ncbi:endonuclease III-like protein 1 [Condylostylus longicornis]|uniref:endonuclease III-like protein 1 n=1 Tax=Condylostylus longicornis TaxID=2530218 RepID=UPI00244DD069|nr:endonuclease III-like protein 1 [Condylostylus longicornis]
MYKMSSQKSPLIGKLVKNFKSNQRLRSKKPIESESETQSSYFSPSKKANSSKKAVNENNKNRNIIKKEVEKEESLSPVKKARLNQSKVKKLDVVKEEKKEIKTKELAQDEKWNPLNWEIILDNIRKMRSESPAPVDTMGCNKCYDENATEKEKRFNILLSLILSPRTKDEVTYGAMTRLKENIIPLTPENLIKKEKETLEELIKPVGFYKNKTKYIVKTCEILINKYNSDIPGSLEELMDLPGVSSKIAHICMNTAWNIVTGIGVDVHVHRISNRLKWVKKETKTPEDTRKELESWAPKELWGEINHLLVGFGQTICQAIKPKCDSCLNKNICPYLKKHGSNSKKSIEKIEKNDLDW